MNPQLVLIALAALALGAATSSSSSSKSKSGGSHQTAPVPGGGWSDKYAPQRIRDLCEPLIYEMNWDGLDTFLVAKAWVESRGNPNACFDDCKKQNAARGWFGMRPSSALVYELEVLRPEYNNVIFNERWAVALAVWYAYRLRNYADSGQVIDWLALARGWAFPSLVNDVDHTETIDGYAPGERSDDVLYRIEGGVWKAGDDPDIFLYERAFPSGFTWIGLEAIFEILEVPNPGAVARVMRTHTRPRLIGGSSSSGGLLRARRPKIKVVREMPRGLAA